MGGATDWVCRVSLDGGDSEAEDCRGAAGTVATGLLAGGGGFG